MCSIYLLRFCNMKHEMLLTWSLVNSRIFLVENIIKHTILQDAEFLLHSICKIFKDFAGVDLIGLLSVYCKQKRTAVFAMRVSSVPIHSQARFTIPKSHSGHMLDMDQLSRYEQAVPLSFVPMLSIIWNFSATIRTYIRCLQQLWMIANAALDSRMGNFILTGMHYEAIQGEKLSYD